MNSESPGNQTRYVIITPVRDEAQHIEDTIRSVAQQTVRPAEWVIVDDGSTDGTPVIVDRLSHRWPWIKLFRRPDRGFRDADVGAVGAFLAGYRSLKSADWEFLINLDGDLTLDPAYFEKCFEEFRKDSSLGIGGGTLYHLNDSGLVEIEVRPRFHVRGATKIYRRACWDAIGGLAAVPGWDTYDEVKAHMAGWRVRSFPNVRALHQRPTGGSSNAWRDAVKNGRCDYFLGYHPVFELVKCLRRTFKKPFLVDGAGHLYSFIKGYVDRQPQVDDAALIRYVRRQQLRRLLFMESTWK
ncbi:MAG TPA: glycosyltransferase family A protein [Terriglobia bacterium]|nr:glycosyltransferase family A protein [Terriglobia bacterium]